MHAVCGNYPADSANGMSRSFPIRMLQQVADQMSTKHASDECFFLILNYHQLRLVG